MDIEKLNNNDKDYELYEKLIINRDVLRKEAKISDDLFNARYGNLIIAIFKLKIESIKKKKIIAYYQVCINNNKSVNEDDLNSFLDDEMKDYYNELNKMIDDNKDIKITSIKNEEYNKIKKIYYKLVKKLHPDINHLTMQNETLTAFWQEILDAYEKNNLEELETLDVLVSKVLKDLNIDNSNIHIDNILDKIKKVEDDIVKIRTNKPYIYKFILNDEKKMKEKYIELLKEYKEYKTYNDKLDLEIDNLKDGTNVWIIN